MRGGAVGQLKPVYNSIKISHKDIQYCDGFRVYCISTYGPREYLKYP